MVSDSPVIALVSDPSASMLIKLTNLSMKSSAHTAHTVFAFSPLWAVVCALFRPERE